MNQNLQKQFKVYTGVAATILASEKASGQITYVDVNPDTIVDASPANSGLHYFLIDIDNDGNSDFNFKVRYTGTSYNYSKSIKVDPLNSNQILNGISSDSNSDSFSVVGKIHAGDTINNNPTFSYSWKNNNNQTLIFKYAGAPNIQYGKWFDHSTFYFFAFRLKKNLDYLYGWIRLKTLTNHSFVIGDYAYNTINNAPIIAGDTINASLSVNEINSGFSISQHNSNVLITSENLIWNGTIKVFDLLGKEILSQNFSGHQTEINIDRKGIFIVEVSSDKSVIRKKVYVY